MDSILGKALPIPPFVSAQVAVTSIYFFKNKRFDKLFFRKMGGPEKGRFVSVGQMVVSRCLAAETVEGTALTFQSVDDVHGGDGLPLGVFRVGHSVTDDVLKEHLQNTTGLLVDETGDTLDTTTASQTADSRLGDALDVVTQHFPVTLGASLSESFASFAASSHCRYSKVLLEL